MCMSSRSQIRAAWFAIVVMVAVSAGCAGRFPAIVPTSGGNEAFLAQVSALHPVGSSGQGLVATLEQQGFKVSRGIAGLRPEPYYEGYYVSDGFMVSCIARVHWRPG